MYAKMGASDPISLAIQVSVQGLQKFIQGLTTAIAKYKDAHIYTTHQEILGERVIDQIPGVGIALANEGVIPASSGQHAAQYEAGIADANIVDRHYGNFAIVVPLAQHLFTILFGVRITTDEDLDALDYGAGAYYARPDKQDIPKAAVDRAVFLKQNFFPISSYNQYQWEMRKFNDFPYAAPVPGLEPGTLYNGPIPGGGELRNGLFVSGGALVQPTTSNTGTGTESTNSAPGSGAASTQGKKDYIGQLLIAAGALFIIFDNADTRTGT